MTDLTELKRLADAAPMAMTMTNGSEEHKALIAFTDEVKRLFGNDVGMARALIAENEALREDLEHAKRQPLYSTRRNSARYLHIKSTWHDGGLLERLEANVLPEDWDLTIDADMGRGAN